MFDSNQKKSFFNRIKLKNQQKVEWLKKSLKNEHLQKFKKSQRFFSTIYQIDDNLEQKSGYPIPSQQALNDLILSQNILKLRQLFKYLDDFQIEQIFSDIDLVQPIYHLVSKHIDKMESILLILKLMWSCKRFACLLRQKTGIIKKIIKEANSMKGESKSQQIYFFTLWFLLNDKINSDNKKQVYEILPNLIYLVQQVSINSEYWIMLVSFLSMFLSQDFQFSKHLLEKVFSTYNIINSKQCSQKLYIYVTIQNMVIKHQYIKASNFKDIVKIIVESQQNLELNAKDYKNINFLLLVLIQKLTNIQSQCLGKNVNYFPQNQLKQDKCFLPQLIEWLLNYYPQLFQYEFDSKFMCLLFQITTHGDFSILQKFYIQYQLVDFLVHCLQVGRNNQLVFLSLKIFQILIQKLMQNDVSITFPFFSYLKSKNIQQALQNLNFNSNNQIYKLSSKLLAAFQQGRNFGRH